MSTRPKALVLADALEELDVQFSHTGLCGEAADELRRLHEVNADLLEALKGLAACVKTPGPHIYAFAALEKAHAAIDKATGKVRYDTRYEIKE
jgi:hypothetical protein